MSKSYTTIAITQTLRQCFPWLKEEVPVCVDGTHKYCDLAGEIKGLSVGIEIKISAHDMHSGYGMNQEQFDYGYLMVPENLIERAIGHLYKHGMNSTGVMTYDPISKQPRLVKPARPSPGSRLHPVHYFLSCPIGNLLREVVDV